MDISPETRRLKSIREEAWERIPLIAKLRANLTWSRLGRSAMWTTVQVVSSPKNRTGFDVFGGMVFYSIDSDFALHAPKRVIEAIYGTMLAHTARFSFSSRSTIHGNGNGNVSDLTTWKSSMEVARRWGFAIDEMTQWAENNKNHSEQAGSSNGG